MFIAVGSELSSPGLSPGRDIANSSSANLIMSFACSYFFLSSSAIRETSKYISN